MSHLIWFLLVGLIAGWLAGKVTRGHGYGLWGNLTLGCLGALLGGFLFGLLGIHVGGLIGAVMAAFVGAIVEDTLEPSNYRESGPLPTGDDGLIQTRIVAALIESAKTGHEVRL